MLIDLTHTLRSGMPVYPGDSVPEITRATSVETDGFTHYDLRTGVHAGTHMDGPAHMVVGGRKLCDFPPERFITPAKLLGLDAPFGKGGRGDFQITRTDCEEIDLQPGDALLIRSGFSETFDDPAYFTDYPVLTEDAARYLVEKRIGILGIDWPSPDREPFAVHRILLGAEILIIENLTNLEELAKHVSLFPRGSTAKPGGSSFTLHALPMKLDTDSAPCRVIAETHG